MGEPAKAGEPQHGRKGELDGHHVREGQEEGAGFWNSFRTGAREGTVERVVLDKLQSRYGFNGYADMLRGAVGDVRVEVSPDGKNVYVASWTGFSGTDSVAWFRRD